jgi:hypothetical protein
MTRLIVEEESVYDDQDDTVTKLRMDSASNLILLVAKNYSFSQMKHDDQDTYISRMDVSC